MMRLSILVFAVGVVGSAGCESSELRSYEGQLCSTNKNDDPYYKCSPSEDLICVSTYSVERIGVDGGSRPAYVCRLACDPGSGCFQAGDVCCPGVIYGKTYDKTHGCVPASYCETDPVITTDGGAKTDSGAVDGPIDATTPG